MKRNKRSSNSKKGKPYELAIADIFEQLHPTAAIDVGVWVEGPDGRRELDVSIQISTSNKIIKGVIECKDFSPDKTGPVGISYIDELDSKRRDLNLDFAFICSNAGFTSNAMSKAKRVSIGLLSASSASDKRIRFSITDYLYSRCVNIVECRVELFPENPSDKISLLLSKAITADTVLLADNSVIQWIHLRVLKILGANQIVNGIVQDECKFSNPIQFNVSGEQHSFVGLNFQVKIEGAWFRDKVIISSTTGVYNWINRRIKMPCSSGDEIVYKWDRSLFHEWIPLPPQFEEADSDIHGQETEIRPISIGPVYPTENAADLDCYICPSDLDVTIPLIDLKNKMSTPDFPADTVFKNSIDKTIRVKF